MRITSLLVKRPILNRISYWLYKKYCNEPYYPKGKVRAIVNIGNPNCLGHDGRESSVKIFYKPDKFVRGDNTWYIFDVDIYKND